MLRIVGGLAPVVFMLILVGRSAAEPPPVVVPASPSWVVPSPNPAFYRVSQYDVWQYLAVDRAGRFRPRVVYTPSGAYYLYNGRPYPWVATHQRDFMPYARD